MYACVCSECQKDVASKMQSIYSIIQYFGDAGQTRVDEWAWEGDRRPVCGVLPVGRRKCGEGEVAGGADQTLSLSFSEGDLYQWVGGLWRAEPGSGLSMVRHVHNRGGVDPTSSNPCPWRDSVFEGWRPLWVSGPWRAEPGHGLGVVKHVHRREGVDPMFNNPRPWGDSVYEGFATTVVQ